MAHCNTDPRPRPRTAAAAGALLCALALAPAARADRADRLWRAPDDRRPAPLVLPILEGTLALSGQYKLVGRAERDPRLAEAPDDRVRGEHELDWKMLYRPRPSLALFAELKLDQQDDLYREQGRGSTENQLERGEFWLLWDQIAGRDVALQVGRQRFREPRRWWWDEDLDAVRVHGAWRDLELEIAAAQDVAPVSNADPGLPASRSGLGRWLGRAGWRWSENQRVELFLDAQRDRSSAPHPGERSRARDADRVDADLTWLGIRLSGRGVHPPPQLAIAPGAVSYWLDLAGLSGRQLQIDYADRPGGAVEALQRRRSRVRAWALDAGAVLEPDWPGHPRFTLAYAEGSGDGDPGDGTDHAFQQTSLQENRGRLRTVHRVRYYGDLLQPELSNLRIWTASLGIPLLEQNSLELSYHRYRQIEAQPSLRSAMLRIQPGGRDRDIGQELDLSLGVRQWSRMEIELALGVFHAGRAYGERSGRWSGSISAEVDFFF